MASDPRRRVRWRYRRRVLRHPLAWWRERCAHCGRRRFPDESMILMPGSGTFHDVCDGYITWRRKAQERLAVLDVVTDVWEVGGRDVQAVMGLRARDEGADRAHAENAAWRVFYDLDNQRKAKADA